MLDEDGYIRLSDFGLSARAKRGERIHSFSGTATYLAPEIINDTGDKGHTHCVDLWCFGVMLFIMLTQEPPFWAEHYPDLFHLIKSTEVPFHFYDHLSSNAISVLRGVIIIPLYPQILYLPHRSNFFFFFSISYSRRIQRRDWGADLGELPRFRSIHSFRALTGSCFLPKKYRPL